MASPILKNVGICWKRRRTNRTPTHWPLQMLSCEAVNMSLHKRRTSMVPWYDILRHGTIAMKYSLHFRGHGVMVQWPLWQWFQIAEIYQCMSMQCQYLFTSPPVFCFSDVSLFTKVGWESMVSLWAGSWPTIQPLPEYKCQHAIWEQKLQCNPM